MGRRGPRKKLAELDRLDGNPSHRLIEESGIEAIGSPFIPEHLSDDARGCIDIIKQSMPSSVYSALDSFLLSAFAMAWVTHKRATHEINASGFQWTTASKRGSPQASPWIRIANQQAGIMGGARRSPGPRPEEPRGSETAGCKTTQK
jgi:hypothetical protein